MLTCYCKKCNRDVPVRDHCPQCGAKLNPNQAHAAWAADHLPVSDWLVWNAVMRVLLPALCAVLLSAVAAEAALGGLQAVENLLRGGFVQTLVLILLGLSLLLLLILLLQGPDILDCVVDSRGVHVKTYLPEPTALKLMMRLRSPSMLSQVDSGDPAPSLLVDTKDIAWRDVARVQYWEEKNLMLFYAPRYWLRVALPCTPFSWEDAEGFVLEKLGSRKKVRLPASLRPVGTKTTAGGKKKSPAARQKQGNVPSADFLADIRAMNEETARQEKREDALR